LIDVGTTLIPGYVCERCGHVWAPQNKDKKPTICPKCKSPYWNIARKEKKA
jgi:predicted Zn-ribbon and HTH transcriptional regulator